MSDHTLTHEHIDRHLDQLRDWLDRVERIRAGYVRTLNDDYQWRTNLLRETLYREFVQAIASGNYEGDPAELAQEALRAEAISHGVEGRR